MSVPPPLAPRARLHLEQARRNYDLYQRLHASGQDLDWAVTVLFYTALHLVQAYAIQCGPPFPEEHTERRSFVAIELPGISTAYRRLEEASRGTRYELVSPSPAQVQRYHDLYFLRIVAELRTHGVSL